MEDYQFLPLRDVVFNTLRQSILRGELKPGERLMEIQLANQLGVSRTPIREAIRMLELEGLVIMIPRKGAQVAQITEKDLNDGLEVRLGLEELAARFACERIRSEALGDLYQASRKFESLLETDDLQALAKADVDFHDIIYKATDNARLVQLLNNLREQMYRYRVEYLKHREFHPQISREHKELISYLEAGQKGQAEEKIAVHIDKQAQAVLETIRRNRNPEKTE